MRRALPLIFALLLCVPAKAQDAPASMGDVQSELVRAASIIRGVEAQLQEIDGHLAELNTKAEGLEKEYTLRRARMADTLAALTRMGRTPRAAILTRPGGPLQAARTSMLLGASFPVIETEAASYKTLLTDLEKTRRALADKAGQAKTTRAQLRAQHQTLEALLDARSRATGGQAVIWQDEARKVAQLAQAARTLRDFLSGLDTGPADTAAPDLEIIPNDDGQLPVSGIIRVSYGQRDSIGAKSSGLSIEALAGTIVVAPLGGVVRYGGPFRGYGNIVIIAHKGGYYSLLAGLDKISVHEGETIVSGEPIAILENDSDANPSKPAARKTLYYELRYGGQPVNPSRKLPGLG